MRSAFVLGIFHNLLALTSNFFELRADSPQLPAFDTSLVLPDSCRFNMSFCEIPVKMPNEITETTTIVSPEDYDRLTAIAPEWRLSNRGYVVTSRRVHGKYRLTYMHKEVAGESAKHVNGDRLDNRRENLIRTKPRAPPIRLTPAQPMSPLHLHTRHPILDYVQASEELMTDPIGKYNTIQYPSGKVYSGETHNGLPHGLGTLVENNRSSFGWFMYGQFRTGCVLDHPEVCDRLRYLYKQKYIRPIKDGFVVLPSGKHMKLFNE
jgi:hypothetical protein